MGGAQGGQAGPPAHGFLGIILCLGLGSWLSQKTAQSAQSACSQNGTGVPQSPKGVNGCRAVCSPQQLGGKQPGWMGT